MLGFLLLIVRTWPMDQPAAPSTPSEKQTRADEYRDLLALYKSAVYDVLESHNQEDSTRKRFLDPTKSNKIARFMELVRERPIEPDAVDAWVWISEFSPWPPSAPQTKDGDEAHALLVRDSVLSPRSGIALPGALESASGSKAAEQLYCEALVRSPHREVRGRACFWLARFLRGQPDWIRKLNVEATDAETVPGARDARPLIKKKWGEDALKRLEQKSPEFVLGEADALFERASVEFADVSAYGYSDDIGLIGNRAREELQSIRGFAVSQLAPEIEGVDIDGECFKLSDYRGRVVVLTFSGNC
jgi:hypothetical protein